MTQALAIFQDTAENTKRTLFALIHLVVTVSFVLATDFRHVR